MPFGFNIYLALHQRGTPITYCLFESEHKMGKEKINIYFKSSISAAKYSGAVQDMMHKLYAEWGYQDHIAAFFYLD